METRLSVEIDSDLKKEIQMEALRNNTTLKEIIKEAIKFYLKSPAELQAVLNNVNEDIEIT